MGTLLIPLYDGTDLFKLEKAGVYPPNLEDLGKVRAELEKRSETGTYDNWFRVEGVDVFVWGDYADAADAIRRIQERGVI